jgi:hypothetical protein
MRITLDDCIGRVRADLIRLERLNTSALSPTDKDHIAKRLKVYKKFLDTIDKPVVANPEKVTRAVQAVLPGTAQRNAALVQHLHSARSRPACPCADVRGSQHSPARQESRP